MTSPETLIQLAKNCLPMLDFQRIATLTHLLTSTHILRGDVVEFGCYAGRTAALMMALSDKELYLYDSFEGLPERSEFDTGRADLCPGALKCEPQTILRYFEDFKLPAPIIIKRWFQDLTPSAMPEQVAFCHIDCDYWVSTIYALELVLLRMVRGGICLIDDYTAPDLPGVKCAVDSFLKGKGQHIQIVGRSAFISF